MKGEITMTKDAWIFTGIGIVSFASLVALNQYNKNRSFKLKEKATENEKIYFEKLSPEQVEALERQKLDNKAIEIELRKSEAELQKTEAELKKTVTQFKEEIEGKIRKETQAGIEKDMRRIFDDWSGKIEDRLDKKVDRVISRIDDLSDKYGGVKSSSSTPSINVVNAPNTNN